MSHTKKVFISLLLGAVTLGVLSGCASKDITVIGDKRVDIIDHRTFKEGNFIKAVIDLENNDYDTVEGFVYRIEWFDKDRILKETTAWKPIVIHKNQKVQIVEMSNLPDVTTYKIVISVPEKL
ncbi:MAG: DUF1425 domain-containing protein [Sulfuricurvum sp.]|nr:DUF1425 domain-containing protein [Sulfuricurvum sp.]